ncbi:hypothetical protein CAOG_06905 [Capsaspora owczarzaki ATCC 30864]|uniref:Calponin-homology (CH) domain-containing protein n=1 Tax=Capsaspora owczarzaki (strain ATCC 30864) TaxID=595528 RepID=A0A0D2WV49_CAPO3|nr:hypothetical protein CAOG_06905 [Capsaspora owczarzaki ATCC 30864]KJE96605.1 hypothetical protein CAOG_006905 [Capsaspora owczarzaki ATCC 30864]|eukprot:XP_004344526.1 hypothetical protein CAOG_06905 [Capsaspora owczarzaki ATCC 30864]
MNSDDFSQVEENKAALRQRQDDMQQRTFTKWYNSYLKHRNINVNNLIEDMHDAVILLNLLEIISSEKIGKYNKAPKMRVMKLENASAAIDFIKRHDIKLTGIGPEDLVDGNQKLILGLSWMLILRYEIQKFSQDIQELLRWCKARTAGYPNVRVQNFTESFNDGLAFCALINKHYPNLLDFDKLDPAANRENLERAFDIAEREFGVPKLLDVQDMLDGPDEKSVITYVSKLRQAFADKDNELTEAARLAELRRLQEEEDARRRAQEEEELRRREQELKAAADALNAMFPSLLARQEHEAETDRLKGQYGPRADDLAEWIANNDRNMGDQLAHVNDLNGDEVLAALDNLNRFDESDKPPRHDELLDLGQLYDQVNARLAKEGRPPFDHPHGIKQLNNGWNGMENTERDLRNALLARAKRLGLVQPLIERFRRISARLTNWRETRSPLIDSTEFGDSEVAVLGQLREFKRVETEVAPQLAAVRSLDSLGRLIKQQDNSFNDEVDGTLREQHGFYDQAQARASNRRAALQKELERQQRLEEERTVYGRRTNELAGLCDEGEEYVNYHLESVDTADILRQYHQRLDTSVDGINANAAPQGFDREIINALFVRVDHIRGAIRDRAGHAEQAAQRAQTEAGLNRSVDAINRDFKNWHNDATRNVAILHDDIATQSREPAHQHLDALRRNLPAGQDKVEQLRTHARQLRELADSQAHSGSANSPAALNLRQSSQEAEAALSNADALVRAHQQQIERLQGEVQVLDSQQLTVPNPNAVRQALKTLSNPSNGVLEEQALRDRGIREEHIGYLNSQIQAAPRGGLDYDNFDPYRGRTFTPATRKASISAASSAPSTPQQQQRAAPTLARQPSQPSTPYSPASSAAQPRALSTGSYQQQLQSPSFQPAGSNLSSPSTFRSGGANNRLSASYNDQPVSSPSSGRPSSTYNDNSHSRSPRPTSSVGGSGIGPDVVVDGTRQSSQIEENVILHVTQSDDLPVIVKYELEVHKSKRIDFTLSTEGSQNLEVAWPTEGDGVRAQTSVNPFECRTIAVLRQVDPYASASLRVKYSWKSKDA